MKKYALLLLIAAGAAFGQYKTEPAGPAPAGVVPAVSALFQQPGTRIVDSNGKAVAEVWFRNSIPSGPKSAEANVAFPSIPHGALMGLIRFPAEGADRRGQAIKPGVYTLRYSVYPVDGAHQGVAPQRDFLLLVPAAADKDPDALPAYEQVVDMSRKASGTPHPAVLSIQAPLEGEAVPGFVKEGENDWVLNTKVGDTAIGIILIGKHEG